MNGYRQNDRRGNTETMGKHLREAIVMNRNEFGIEGITEEDRAYNGSRFSDVCDAIFANPYQKIWGGEGGPPLPFVGPTLSSLLRRTLPLGQPYFGQAAKRTVDSHADLRWGPDGKGFRRLIHPNGVCLTGLWEITEPTEYTGYFRKDSHALVVGRYSTGANTKRGKLRAQALAGKLFPTTDPSHPKPFRTANFFAMEDIAGENTRYINDAELRSAPNVTPWRSGKAGPFLALAVAGVVFTLVDKTASMRQLYPIAELGKPLEERTRAPLFMRLLASSEQPRIEGDGLDIRDEILAQIYDKGDPVPKRKLIFHIEVTDEGTRRDILGFVRCSFKNWRRIGKLTFDNAVASYNGDRVLHFNHPGWRDDQNNPATANRAALS
jgi:hypothetical protein